MRKKYCVVCRKTFYPKKQSNNRVKYCSIKCKSKDYYNKYYEHFVWKKDRKCDYCGKNFIPKTVNQINCSLACRGTKWKKKNWDKVLEDQRKWFKKARKKNPEKFRWYVKNRRHLIRSSSGSSKTFGKTFSLNDWNDMKKKYGYKCAGCKEKIILTIDHKIPLSKKGLHLKENIQPLCRSCNSRKKDKLPL